MIEDLLNEERERKIDAFKQVYPGIYSEMNEHIKNKDGLRYINNLEVIKQFIPDYMIEIYKRIYIEKFEKV
jgi:hypothetical protein